MIYGPITDALRSFQELSAQVSRNESFNDASDQLVIRPGNLGEDDPLPGLVLALPDTEIEGDLAFRGGFAVSKLEVRAIAFSLAEAWRLAKAAAWNGGDPDDTTRVTSGLDGYKDLSKGIQAVRLLNIAEDPIEPDDKSDRRLWVIEATYEVHFDVGTILRLES